MGTGPRWKDRRRCPKRAQLIPGLPRRLASKKMGDFRWSGREDDGLKPNNLSSTHPTVTNGGIIGQSPCGLGRLCHCSICFLPSPSQCVCVCVCVSVCARTRACSARGSAIAKTEITSATREKECEECDTHPSSGPGGEKPANKL